jgi:hypothetical protein
METTAEQLNECAQVEYIFGHMLLDPKVQHFFGADERIASSPDVNPVAITAQYILYALEGDYDEPIAPTLESIRKLRDETRAALA